MNRPIGLRAQIKQVSPTSKPESYQKQYLNFRSLFPQKSIDSSYMIDDSRASTHKDQSNYLYRSNKTNKSYQNLNTLQKTKCVPDINKSEKVKKQMTNSNKNPESENNSIVELSISKTTTERVSFTSSDFIEQHSSMTEHNNFYKNTYQKLNMSPIQQKSQHTITQSQLVKGQNSYNFSKLLVSSAFNNYLLEEQNSNMRDNSRLKKEQNKTIKIISQKKAEEQQNLPTFGTKYIELCNGRRQEQEEQVFMYSSDLKKVVDFEQIFEEEMKKMYQNGRMRTFMSSQSKITAQKYELELI